MGAGQNRRNKRKSRNSWGNRMALIGITIVVMSLGVVTHVGTASLREKEQEYAVKEQNLEKTKAQEEARAAELEEYRIYVQTKQYVEKVAKEKLGLVNEDEILFKVFDRIFENLASVDGKPDFSSISAESLNMDDDLFNITLDALRPYITGEKIIGENVQNVKNTNDKLLRIPRMKSKSESGSDLGDGWYMGGGNSGNTGGGNEGGNMGFGGGGYIPPTTYDPWPVEMVLKFLNATISKDAMFGHICKVFNLSDFEEKCFSQYWYAKGDLYLDENDWQGIKRIAESFVQQNDWESLKKKIGKNSMNIEITAQGDTIQYYKQVINFYDYDNYNYALGSSTINFTEEGQAVGLYDVYDFNYGVEIKRDEWDNAITIAAGVIGELYGAVSYIMIYGVF